MNLHELDSYNLADAVKFHNRLNPRLWDKTEHLLPEVRNKLLEIAADFQEFLGVPDLDVVDITVSGSNAAYSYTPHSDIDLHLVVRMPEQNSEVFQELFNAKKYQYNDEHDIRIGGADVELYVQPVDQKHHSLGIYSVKNNDWVQVPRRRKIELDDQCVAHKTEDLAARIDQAVASGSKETMQRLWDKIKTMRQTGLEQTGEFGCDNLVFKMLRRSGHIERLKQAKTQAHDRELSLTEKKKRKKAKKKFTYGAFGGWFYPGYNFSAGETGDGGGGGDGGESVREVDSGIAQGSAIGDAGAQSTWDGVSPDTDEYLSEDDVDQSALRDFIRYAADKIGLRTMPRIHIHNDPEWSEREKSFGRFEPEDGDLHINMWNRHIMDVFRTAAHELAHARQHEIKSLGPDAGATGSDIENEANAVAGIIMRHWAKMNPNMFESIDLESDLTEGKISRAFMAATIAAAAAAAQAQDNVQDQPQQLTVGSVLSTALKLYGISKITSPQVKAELDQEVRNYLRAQQGDANARNISWTWRMQQNNALPKITAPQQQNESSGYIPTKKQAKDPRFVMALSPDVQPGATGKNANKMALKTDSQGRPALLMKTVNLREGRMPQPSQGRGRYRELNQPLGPETPPTMPAGTVRVDVSDVYDWYKLGQHISNMKGLGKHDFGAGPPSSIISFGDEETEHKFIQDLKRTGLDVTDIDPKDPKQPQGMPKIKTDPTYNVAEAFDQPYSLKWEKSEYGDYDALATLEDGTHLSIMFEHTTPYEVAVSFWRNNSQEVTGEGDAQRIFATVLAAIQQFLKQEQPANITFSAVKEDDPSGSRSKLYNKLVQRYAGAWGYQARSFDHDDKVEFELTKIQQNADESELVESLRQEFALLEDEFLGEIKMTGKNLRAEAAKTGALAGMEFEMIVPNVETDIEPEYEPDWDRDERTRSFRNVRDFFHDGDYNGRREVDNLMEELTNEYEEWVQEQIDEEWQRDGVDYMRDFIDVNDLFDRDEAMAEARDEVMTANPDLPQESEDFQQLVSARIDELQERFVLEAYEDQGRIYNDAFETFADEQREEYDEGSFLDATYQTMSDIQSNFDISWPYYYDVNDGQDGDLDIDQVADDFSNSIGKPVNASRSYHGARREPGHYVVEPDGSLEGDNPGDGGLEFVSPPMPIDELLSDLNKVKAWADREGCYTNDSTGLHINISVPDYSIDKLDYVKLAILMGDEYILDLFGRSGNTYAKSAMGKIKSALKQKPEAAAQIMDLMKQGLDGAATKAIHTGITDKYTSINTKTGYIEFRSPGGDWLDSNFANIENTLLRFTVALSAAINPEAYRKEYLTKLYKLLSEGMDKSDTDVIQLFSNYSAGELDKPALIRQVRQKQLARNVAKGKATGKMWWRVSNPANSFASIEVVADNAEEAIASAILPGNYPDWARVRNTLKATPIRPYEAPTAQSKQGSWGIWLDGAERFVRIPRSEDGGDGQALRRFDSESAARTWLNNYRDRNPGVRTDISIREIPADYQWPPADTAASTQTPSVPQGGNTGNWGVWVPALDRYATIGNAGPRRFDTEADAQAWIQDYNTRHSGNDIGLVAQQVAAAQPEFQEPNAARGDLTPRGPGPWEIYRISDNSSVRDLTHTDRQMAGQEARMALGMRGEAPELYGVRTRQAADATQGGTVDVAGEQPAAPQAQQQWTGEWLILDPNDRVIHRFGGIGNSQTDANNFAVRWLQQNPRHLQAGVTVVPEMQ